MQGTEGSDTGTATGRSRVSPRGVQTEDSISFQFNVEGAYSHFFYNTSKGGEHSVIKVVMQNETDQQFVRLHLGGAIDAGATVAEEVSTGGVKVVMQKAELGYWRDAVHFASQQPLTAAVPVTYQGVEVAVEASEFHYLEERVRAALEATAPDETVAAEDLAHIVRLLEESFEMATPVCGQKNACSCREPNVFDGRKCVASDAWVEPGARVVSRSHINLASNETRVTVTAADMLALNTTEFSVLFDRYQQAFSQRPAWPYMMYAQTLRSKKILAIGAGINHFEPMIMVREGSVVTFVDPDQANLDLMERLANLTAVPKGMMDLVRYEGPETLDALPDNYDAVLVLDSLTKAPSELLYEEYAAVLRRLRLGGRWLQLAPSRSNYALRRNPTYQEFAAFYDAAPRSEGRSWLEWLDVNKLMTLLPQGAKFQVMFGADVGSHPPVYPDVFHWIDMVYRGAPTAAPAA